MIVSSQPSIKLIPVVGLADYGFVFVEDENRWNGEHVIVLERGAVPTCLVIEMQAANLHFRQLIHHFFEAISYSERKQSDFFEVEFLLYLA